MILGTTNHEHSSCFYEIDEAVTALQKERGDDRIVAFNVHNFPHELKEGMICYNFDFPGIHFPEDWYKQLIEKYEVWDHCKLTADKYGTKHAPVGYHPSMKLFDRAKEQEVDIAFFGSPHPRRAELLKKLSDAGFSVYASTTAYRQERDEVLSKCKVALNPLYYEHPGVFPILRAAHCWANKVPLISEEALEAPRWSCNYPYKGLFDTIVYFLKQEDVLLKDWANWDYEDFVSNPMVLPT